jgi:hypothetical protein
MFLHSRDKQDPDWTKSDLLKIAENDHQTIQAGPKSSSLENSDHRPCCHFIFIDFTHFLIQPSEFSTVIHRVELYPEGICAVDGRVTLAELHLLMKLLKLQKVLIVNI